MVSTPPHIEWSILHDARAVHDVGVLDFGLYCPAGTAMWILSTIRPNEDSGSATIPDGHINSETGELVLPPDATMVIVVRGKYQLMAADPKQTNIGTGEYSWTRPADEQSRTTTWDDIYSPFIHGGAILFAPQGIGGDREFFGHDCLLFSKWARLVEDALKQYKSEAALQPGADVQVKHRDKLNSLCSAENHIVAVLAMQKLIMASACRADLVENAMKSSNDQHRAVTVFLVLSGPDDARTTKLVAEIDSFVNSASKLDELRSAALGAFSVVLDPQSKPRHQERAKAMLERVRQRQSAIGSAMQDDAMLKYIHDRTPKASSAPRS